MKTFLFKSFSILLLLIAPVLSECRADGADSVFLARLEEHLATLSSDMARVKYLDSLRSALDDDEEFVCAQKEYELALKTADKYCTMSACYTIALTCYYNSDYQTSLEYLFRLLQMAEEENNPGFLNRAYTLLGNNYSMFGDKKCLDYYRKAISYAYQTEGDNTEILLQSLNALWQENIENNMIKEASAEKERVRRIIFAENSKATTEDIADFYYMSGYGYMTQMDPDAKYRAYTDSATTDLYKALELYLSPDISSKKYIARIYYALTQTCYNNLTYYKHTPEERQEITDSCLHMLDKGMEYAEKYNMASSLFNMTLIKAELFIETDRFAESEAILDSIAGTLDLDDDSDIWVFSLAASYSTLYKKTGNHENLSYWLQKKIDCLESVDRNEISAGASLVAVESEYEQEKRRSESERIALAASAKWRMAVIALLGIGFIVTIGFWLKSRRQNRQLNEQNDLLADRHEEIMVQNERLKKQNDVIETQNRDMQGSLRYAKQIQKAVMPNAPQMQQLFSDSMVYLRPLNIVSGDFYWVGHSSPATILAVGDCTGHGVPGAVLSMLGMSLLNEVTSALTPENLSASAVLNLMNAKFIAALRQTTDSESNHDSIDIAVIVIDRENSTLHYAGAFRPLITASANGIKRLSADRQPIGVSENARPFTDNVLQYAKGDALYMFSDGITDQFGYSNGHETKFGRQRLEDLIGTIWQQPMRTQQNLISQTFRNWTARPDGTLCEQLDDMLLVGIRL